MEMSRTCSRTEQMKWLIDSIGTKHLPTKDWMIIRWQKKKEIWKKINNKNEVYRILLDTINFMQK